MLMTMRTWHVARRYYGDFGPKHYWLRLICNRNHYSYYQELRSKYVNLCSC